VHLILLKGVCLTFCHTHTHTHTQCISVLPAHMSV